MSRLELGEAYGPGVVDYSYTHSDAAFEQAEKEGLEVVLPKPSEIFVDIDTPEAHRIFNEQLGCLGTIMPIVGTKVTPSRSGAPHYHAIVMVEETLETIDQIALGAALGSDRRCILLQYRRLYECDPHPILFLEKKDELPTVSVPTEQ